MCVSINATFEVLSRSRSRQKRTKVFFLTDGSIFLLFQHHPSIKLKLDNLKGEDKTLGMKDIRSLVASTLTQAPVVPWADIKCHSLITHVAIVTLDSLSHELYEKAVEKGLMPFLSSNFEVAPAKAPGNATRVHEGLSVLLRYPMSNSALKAAKKERAANLASLPTKSTPSNAEKETKNDETANSDVTSTVPLAHIQGPAINTAQLAERKELTKTLAQKSLFSEKTETSPGQLLMTLSELQRHKYPLKHTVTEEGYIEIPKYHESDQQSTPQYHLLAIDCEMCRTTEGIELTRVVVVNMNLETVYDSYVKPRAHIVDYLTRYSGITVSTLSPVTVRLEDVQNDLLEIITPQTILIGHSLENDLKALKLMHTRVIDTALLYPHTRGDTFKNSLKFLAETWLGENIQNGEEMIGHDPTQDAETAMKLAFLKFRNGPAFGRSAFGDKEENICELLYRQQPGKRTCIIDNAHACKMYAGSHTDLNAEEDDTIIVSKSSSALSSCRYEFVSARLRSLAKYYASLEKPVYIGAASTSSGAKTDENGDNEDGDEENGKNTEAKDDDEPKQSNEKTEEPSTSSSADASAPVLSLDHYISSSPDLDTELRICAELDSRLRVILSDLSKRTLVIVTGGNGNLARVRTIVNVKRKMQALGEGVWSEVDDVKSRMAFEKARHTIVGFWIPPANRDADTNTTSEPKQ